MLQLFANNYLTYFWPRGDRTLLETLPKSMWLYSSSSKWMNQEASWNINDCPFAITLWCLGQTRPSIMDKGLVSNKLPISWRLVHPQKMTVNAFEVALTLWLEYGEDLLLSIGPYLTNSEYPMTFWRVKSFSISLLLLLLHVMLLLNCAFTLPMDKFTHRHHKTLRYVESDSVCFSCSPTIYTTSIYTTKLVLQ